MRMRIKCDVCEKGAASVVCCADQAALCSKCDSQVHAANKLANNHERLDFQLSNTPTLCDICREKPAFIFCVEDRALFCQECDHLIHSSSKLAATHQRFLAAGVQPTASPCNNNNLDPNHNHPPKPTAQTFQSPPPCPDLLDFEELEWLTEMSLFVGGSGGDSSAPQEPTAMVSPHPSSYNKPATKSNNKKSKMDISTNVDHDEYSKVPDLG
ncbi:B-box zinc finger protein 25-like [Impatiens glandulifera]|uniref:B-box zinc finger protein 25-like n=1 Tax=Impatiens glandulifera TaxID=253017 RepID=UPI001FB0F500|nr:B-box zinc finger protein 25-like [Impatiens glandulifera]